VCGLGVAVKGYSVCARQVSMVVWGFCGREPHLATAHTVVFAPCTVALVAPSETPCVAQDYDTRPFTIENCKVLSWKDSALPRKGSRRPFWAFFGSDPSTLELFGKPKLAGGAAGISFISIPVRAAGDAPPGSLGFIPPVALSPFLEIHPCLSG